MEELEKYQAGCQLCKKGKCRNANLFIKQAKWIGAIKDWLETADGNSDINELRLILRTRAS